MAEHQYTQQPKKTDNTSQKQTIPPKQIPTSHPVAIIQRARINPKSLTHADVMQLQRTIGNRAVGRLLTEIGLIPSKVKQAPTVQMHTMPEEKKEPLQGEMAEAIQCQEIPEEEEPLQGKMAGIVQRQELEEEEKLQMKSVIQRQEIPEEEELLQGKFESKPEQEACPSCSILSIQQKKENHTGMPDNLKAGVENLSGLDMSDVRVYFNSDKPAEVGALAYTQGTNIHVAPGQEKHLPHEAWHVVQQAKGRVIPTIQLKGVLINNDIRLEKEADEMGARIAEGYFTPPMQLSKDRPDWNPSVPHQRKLPRKTTSLPTDISLTAHISGNGPIQRWVYFADSNHAEVAQHERPYGERIWVSVLENTNNELFPTAESAESAAKISLGVNGDPDYTVEGNNLADSHKGTYKFWNGPDPPAYFGVPTHNNDNTNIFFEISNTRWRMYSPIIHNHAVTYNDFNAINNPGANYITPVNAREHYLHKPVENKMEKLHKKAIKLDAESGQKKGDADTVVRQILDGKA